MNRLVAFLIALLTIAPLTLSAQQARRPAAKAPATKVPAAKPPAAKAPAAAPRGDRPVPFKVGETLTYDVSYSSYLTAGTATTTVKEKKASSNANAYYIVAEGRPTALLSKLYSLYYKMDTLLDTSSLLPQRGSVYSEEGSKHRFKVSNFDHVKHKVFFEYESVNKANDTFAVPPYAQDALSAVYVLRSIALKGGDRMTMPVTDNGIVYKLAVDVGANERVKTPFGEAAAWKLKLALTDTAGKPQGRNMALWLTDDARRLPMKLQAELPIGSFNLNLREAR